MRLAIDKSRNSGVGIICVRNTHHLGPAGYFAHMAVEHGLLGLCMTGHFFGKGYSIGVAPLGSFLPMFSTNPLAFAAPCGRHPPFVLDMSTSVVTVNRIEMHAQEGRPIPAGWARDAAGNPTTDPAAARVLLPLGGTPELGGYKGAGLAMMVSILSGVLSAAWAPIQRAPVDAVRRGSPDPAVIPTEGLLPHLESVGRAERAGSGDLRTTEHSNEYDQPTMGHFFTAIRIDAFQPLDCFRSAMDAMIDALHAAPPADPNGKPCYPGEVEAATAAERTEHGIPVNDRLFHELRALAERLGCEMPPMEGGVNLAFAKGCQARQ
jgi:LDH2 family malate/lactate/ureidoglycolate dehydrogenase